MTEPLDGVGYVGERPTWFVRVVHPARFAEVGFDLRFKLFLFPTSALVAVLLRFLDEPHNPYCFHRVFDLAAPDTHRYLDQVAREPSWLVVINGRGTEPGPRREIQVDGAGLADALRAGEGHLERLRRRDGGAAIDDFLKVFKAEAETRGFQAGWRAVDGWLEARRPKEG